MKKIFVYGLIIVFWSALAVCGAEEIIIGTLFDHSGALKDWGPRHQKAAELAAKHLAAAGLQVVFVNEDSQTAPEPAKKAAQKLIEQNVVAILGSSSSGVIVPVAESVTCPNNVLMVSPGATSPYITGLPQDSQKDLLFRTCPSDALQGAVLGKLAAGLYKTASVMYVNNAYGQGLADQFRRSFQKHGGLVFTMIPHTETVAKSYKEDLRKAFTRVFSTKPYISGKSEVLCAFSYPEQAKIYVKEAIDDYGCKQFLFSDGTKSEELAQAVGIENVEGMFGTAPGMAVGEAFFSFSSDYEADYGELPKSPFIANTYDAAAVIGLAAGAVIAKKLPLTSETVRNHLREVANPPGIFIGPGEFEKAWELLRAGKNINYEGASGSVDFDQNGDVVTPIEIWRFSNGKISTFRMEYHADED